MAPRIVARKASVNPALTRSLRDILSLPPDGYQGVLEEYRRLRLDVQERHEAQLYLGMQSFRLWLMMSGTGRNKLTPDEVGATLRDALTALESQDHNGYQRLRTRLKAFAGPNGTESSALEFFSGRVAEIELPMFQKGQEIPKAEDILIGVLYRFIVYPLAKDLEAEDWQAQSLKESMSMKAAMWALTESNTTKINREQKQKAVVGQSLLWGMAFLLLLGMAGVGWKMGLFFGKNSDPILAMNLAKSALKASDFNSAIDHGEQALVLWRQRKGTKKDLRPVRELLAEAYLKAGQKDRSREFLLQLKSDFPKEKSYQKKLKELDSKPPPKKPKK